MNLEDKKKLYKKASKAYYNDSPIMTDAEFDKLEREIAKSDPEWSELKKTGVKVADKKTEVKLTKLMPSLRKVYPEGLDKWRAKQKVSAVLAMHKLDGSALQLEYKAGKPVKLVTRGNGELGGDISFLIPHLKLPRIKDKSHLIFRCEAVIKNKTFHAAWSKKALGDKSGFDNPRNMVNGLLNRMKPHPGLKAIDIVVLGVYGQPMLSGLGWAVQQGLSVVPYSVVELDIDFEARLARARKASLYDIDGLALVNPDQVFDYENADKPKWITAFKTNDDADAQDAVVKSVVWQDSRNSRLMPKIEIEPIKMKGVTVTYATAHNAKWMADRGIGPGAVVRLVRSGDVIPKIVGVAKKVKPAKPDVAYKVVGVHYVAIERSREADVREVTHFFVTLGIEHLAAKTVGRLYDVGYKTVEGVLSAEATDFEEAGIGKAMTAKIFAEMERKLRTEGCTVRELMVASNCFGAGMGDRKLKAIEAHYKEEPRILAAIVAGKAEKSIREMLAEVPGFAGKTVDLFMEGRLAFREWVREIRPYYTPKLPAVVAAPVKGKLSGRKFSFTGYRDKEQEAWLAAQGGEVVSFGAKTQVLFYKDGGKASSKIDSARDKGIEVQTFEAFKKGLK